MRKTIIETPVSPGVIRYRVILQDEVPCEAKTHDAMIRQYEVMRILHESPAILACGYQPWDKLAIWHDGSRWTVEAEATLQKELTTPSGGPTLISRG